ncbi:unnamed protein product [Caenorhabditis bovis]|uniref:Serine hydrolase domain-containing protein n=1 Tax=Caenorhabditis bovis TaxID=2654633 RepID=A0A8S1EXH8_9PELO|nr:unnamed protein product [Caenorhabditis bovis]
MLASCSKSLPRGQNLGISTCSPDLKGPRNYVNRRTGRGSGYGVLPRFEWRYERATGRNFQKSFGLRFGFDMGLEDRLLLSSLANKQRRLDGKKMKQLATILEERISEVMSTDETLACLALQLTKVTVDKWFSVVNVHWMCRGDGDDYVKRTLDEARHQLRRKTGEIIGITCPEIRFIGDRTNLMELEMDNLFRNADYGVDYRTLSRSARVLGNAKPDDEQKTGSARKVMKNFADFEFMNAPHKVAADNNVETSRGWWFSNEETMSFSSREPTNIAIGFDESIAEVLKFIEQNGPFDGLMGFSQGASMAHLLIAKAQLGEIDLKGIRFAIFFSGFLSLSTMHDNLTQLRIVDLPSLHLYGNADEIVASSKSELLADRFEIPAIRINHEGGHFVPTLSKQRAIVNEFLQRICNNKK